MHILCQQTNQKWLIELDSNDCLEIMVNKIREPQSNINCILWRQWSVWPLMGQYQLAKIAVDQTANVYTAGKGIVRCSATRYTHTTIDRIMFVYKTAYCSRKIKCDRVNFWCQPDYHHLDAVHGMWMAVLRMALSYIVTDAQLCRSAAACAHKEWGLSPLVLQDSIKIYQRKWIFF